MRKTLFALLLIVPLMSLAAEPFVVRDMRVEGLQRISEGTVFNYLPINIGDTLDGFPHQRGDSHTVWAEPVRRHRDAP